VLDPKNTLKLSTIASLSEPPEPLVTETRQLPAAKASANMR
jgi:hypothetical protein